MQVELYNAIASALEGLGVTDAAFVVERPGDFSHGDYATNAALVAAKQLGKSPRDVAAQLREILLSKKSSGRLSGEAAVGFQTFSQEVFPSAVEKIEIAGPGFINFYLSADAISAEVAKIAGDTIANIPSDVVGQVIMVEYTQPNPFKPFHIGHLMSNTYGESLVRLLRDAGAQVIPVNYQGDVGLHIAKALWGLIHKGYDAEDVAKIGEAYVYGNTAYEEDSEAKKEIVAINKQVYAQDPAILSLYVRGREVTLAHFEELYHMLGTKFEHYFFESEVWKMGESLVREGLAKGVFKESDGAIIFPGEDFGLHTRVFITREGLPTYEAKDLGLAMAKLAYAPFDLSITTTAVEQGEYFKVVFEALAQLRPELRGKFTRVTHGLLHLTSGKMSSRKGNVITGESLLLDLTAAAKAKMEGRTLKDPEKTAEQIAVGAIKYAVLKQGSGKDIIFDPEKSLSLEGDSGPYLQYAHTRASSLLRAAKEAGVAGGLTTGKSDVAAPPLSPAAETVDFPVASQQRKNLERLLLHFPEVVVRAVAELEPHHINTYLTELASAFNSWYANSRVIGSEEQEYGVLLTQAFAHTMQKGLDLLGIPVPEEM